MADFDIECFQNEFLPAGGTLMNAVITVTARGTSSAAGHEGPGQDSEQRAEVLILDTSGSMKGAKLAAAKVAAAAAIDCLPDGVRFAVLAGNHEAQMVYPAVVAAGGGDDHLPRGGQGRPAASRRPRGNGYRLVDRADHPVAAR